MLRQQHQPLIKKKERILVTLARKLNRSLSRHIRLSIVPISVDAVVDVAVVVLGS